MYKEVAVDPTCIADDACFFALREQFGFEKGRYLIADGKRWLSDAMAAVKEAQGKNELKPVRAKTIKAWLNKARGNIEQRDRQILLPLNRTMSPEVPTWNDWWAEQQAIRNFDVSVVPASNPPQTYDFTQLATVANWQVSPSFSVAKTAESIVAALEPLLRISKEVYLLDNYFRLGSNKVLTVLISTAARVGCTRLRIITACACPNPAAVWEREYEGLTSSTLKCDWVIVPDKYFHDRYLITDTGALKAGHGFLADVAKGIAADTLNLSYCAFNEAQITKQQIDALLSEKKASIIWSN